MTPTRNGTWFRRKVRELGNALAALTPGRRALAQTQVLQVSPVPRHASARPGAYNAPAKRNGRERLANAHGRRFRLSTPARVTG